MAYKYFSRNGTILPVQKAVVALSNVEYSYGFGVYETIRVTKGTIYFPEEHCKRLMESAAAISLAHPFTAGLVIQSIKELLAENAVETCNLKILLIGGATAESATFDILCLNPLFPDRKLYKQGAHTITTSLERPFPHAKTLNMLPSYLAYREAKAKGAYDALLISRDGNITEGSSTNFFALKDRTIFTPKEEDILLGVTRDNVLKLAKNNGFQVKEQDIKLASIKQYDGAFLTSTSAKIMPIRSIDEHEWGPPTPDLQQLMKAFDDHLTDYASHHQH